MKKTFGLPYMGSKNETAENIVSMFPRGRRLLDLFGGGASVTHAALVSGRFEQVVYNDIAPLMVDMLNRLKDEPLPPLRFVDRVEFKERYKVDPMVFFCWKFPSSGIGYMFSSGTEKLHELIFKLHEEREKDDPGTKIKKGGLVKKKELLSIIILHQRRIYVNNFSTTG